ncbi:hypothetical protein ORI89_04015 [Sphingobacterium sp. UT-1RO-CII-1]|uniref:hypothetical protein n=1 Tax=Sphingobacterium sp. UT-1RO-CII-1 TaxID=2995225 RepID=UPI00227CB327|nr:hypothetical protein [Sphingobacterium sp. UT-1RO-CII-1]MCY4778805.1 hypothetical protein [Sphingobacterium sp. UT-1RO-CII-1]
MEKQQLDPCKHIDILHKVFYPMANASYIAMLSYVFRAMTYYSRPSVVHLTLKA